MAQGFEFLHTQMEFLATVFSQLLWASVWQISRQKLSQLLSAFQISLSIYLLERKGYRERNRQRQRETDLPSTGSFPSRNSMLVSHISVRGPSAWALLCCLLKCISRKGTWNPNMGCQCFKQQRNTNCRQPSLSSLYGPFHICPYSSYPNPLLQREKTESYRLPRDASHPKGGSGLPVLSQL